MYKTTIQHTTTNDASMHQSPRFNVAGLPSKERKVDVRTETKIHAESTEKEAFDDTVNKVFLKNRVLTGDLLENWKATSQENVGILYETITRASYIPLSTLGDGMGTKKKRKHRRRRGAKEGVANVDKVATNEAVVVDEKMSTVADKEEYVLEGVRLACACCIFVLVLFILIICTEPVPSRNRRACDLCGADLTS